MQTPTTNTVVSYAYHVRAGGKDIGTLQGFSVTSSRQLDRVRGIGEVNDTFEIVPGRTDITITLDRLETYASDILEVFFGSLPLRGITEVANPFTITEEITNTVTGQSRRVEYTGCWIQSVGKTIREGTVTVGQNVTIFPTRITATSSSTAPQTRLTGV